jgi:single-stranded DNA-binding protein
MFRKAIPSLMSRLGSSTCVLRAPKSINSVTLVGVVHDIQSGFVYEDAVTQFTLTTTSIDTTNTSQECVVEKDHHTIRCYGDLFSAETKNKIKEGNVVCVNGRLRLNPQLEGGSNKYYYFPFVHVQPPNGQVSVIHSDRRKAPSTTSPISEEIKDSPTGESSSETKTTPTSGAA